MVEALCEAMFILVRWLLAATPLGVLALSYALGRDTACPSTGKVPPDLDAIRKPTKEHFYRLFREAWDSVNLDRQRDTAIDLAIDEDTVRGALAVEQPDRAWMSPLKRVFRPIKPVIDPLLRAALPLLGRAAIRRSQG